MILTLLARVVHLRSHQRERHQKRVLIVGMHSSCPIRTLESFLLVGRAFIMLMPRRFCVLYSRSRPPRFRSRKTLCPAAAYFLHSFVWKRRFLYVPWIKSSRGDQPCKRRGRHRPRNICSCFVFCSLCLYFWGLWFHFCCI